MHGANSETPCASERFTWKVSGTQLSFLNRDHRYILLMEPGPAPARGLNDHPVAAAHQRAANVERRCAELGDGDARVPCAQPAGRVVSHAVADRADLLV